MDMYDKLHVIEYKGKTVEHGVWIAGDLLHKEELYIVPYQDVPFKHSIGDPVMVWPESICEYTRHTDRDHNRVYENDILRVFYDVDEYEHDDETHRWCIARQHREVFLFQICRGDFGFYAKLLKGGNEYTKYGIQYVTLEGKVICNKFDLDDIDIDDIYDTLCKEVQNGNT